MSNHSVEAQIAVLRTHIEDTQTRIMELADQLECECCGSKDEVATRRIMYDGPICVHCFRAWYECGIRDSEMVRAKSLELQGRPADNQDVTDSSPQSPR